MALVDIDFLVMSLGEIAIFHHNLVLIFEPEVIVVELLNIDVSLTVIVPRNLRLRLQ